MRWSIIRTNLANYSGSQCDCDHFTLERKMLHEARCIRQQALNLPQLASFMQCDNYFHYVTNNAVFNS